MPALFRTPSNHWALLMDTNVDGSYAAMHANFHGSTIQRGWQRTYPNLMSTESVRGAEWYKFDAGYAADAARRNTILVFTRNAVASMDFTPVVFTDAANPHLTSFGHELALSVVFESGIHLSFLGEGNFSAASIADGPDDDSFAESTMAVHAGIRLPVSMRARGGFVATLARASR